MRRVEDEAARLLKGKQEPAAEPAKRTQEEATGSLQREGDFWTLIAGGRMVRLKDVKGLHHLALLLANPGVEFHALEIIARGEGHDSEETVPAAVATEELHTGGQAGVGALLDPQAKAAYRARLDDLQETIDEAEAMNDPERAAHARTEYEEIAHELAAATGLGGRDRPAASDAERARVNATRAIRKTLRRIEAHDARLGRQLARSIKTGTFCSYEPDPDHPISWQVETGP